MSAGNGNQLQRPWGDITLLLGNDTFQFPELSVVIALNRVLGKSTCQLPALQTRGLLQVLPAEQALGRVELLWAKYELCMKIVLFLILGEDRNRHRFI